MKSHLSPVSLMCAVVAMALFAPGCGHSDAPQIASSTDASSTDASSTDASSTDASSTEASSTESVAPAIIDDNAPVNALPPGAESEVEPRQTLTVGDPAPPLSIAAWVIGEPVKELQKDQVYVVEFWATWCPPCRTSMPHLSKLQEEYADQVHFIGVSDEPVDTVNEFLGMEESPGKTWRDVVKYRLAIDDANGTSNSYMRAASQNGIPCAFIVGRSGLVEWIGHPMSMDQPLAKIAAGEWDREAALVELRQQQRVEELQVELSSMFDAQQWDEALAKVAELETEAGSNPDVTSLKLRILQAAGRTEEAAALQGKLVDERWDDPNALNEIAWSIAIGGGERDLDLALKAAQRANELTDEKIGSNLDTLARVYFERGDLEQAIQWQRKAVEFADGNEAILDALQRFEAAQPESDKPASAVPAPEETQPDAAPPEKSAPANE